MNSSFYNGVSGTKTHQFGMDVWANNISNVNNDGFRSSTPEFSSIFSTTMTNTYYGAAMSDKGYGSQAQTTALNLSQGVLRTTDNPFDLALGNEGWFGVRGQDGVDYFTRTGSFSFDGSGTLVDISGFRLLGTMGNNIQPIDLELQKQLTYGHMYASGERSLADVYAISKIDSIPLTAPSQQTQITLPENLYMPSIPTQNITIKANLDAKPDVEVAQIPLNQNDYQSILSQEPEEDTTEDTTDDTTENTPDDNVFTPSTTLNSDGTLNISGSITNTSGLLNPKEGDQIILTITDANGVSVQREAHLNEDLQTWSLQDARIDELDASTDLTITASFRTEQEVPNVERFTSTVIAPNGDKDLLDLRFTQKLPNVGDTTTWSGEAKILKFVETYIIQEYKPGMIFDEEMYTIQDNKIVPNFDSEKYYFDENSKTAYLVVDSQEGEITFEGGGALLSHTIPILNNSGFPLELDLGQGRNTAPITGFDQQIEDGKFSLSGTGLTQGDSLQITINDNQGNAITESISVGENGTWSFSHDAIDFNLDTTDISVIHIIESGWNGVVSNAALDKATFIKDEDGVPEGFLKDYSMDAQGQVVAQFTNSQSIPVAKVAVYHFQNDQGLSSLTGNHFQATVNSGEAIFYTDENGNYIQHTSIMSNRLEGSNVSLATALTELIVIQKAFSSNAKSITTSDEMIQNAIQMKR